MGARQAFRRGESWHSSSFQQRNQFTASVNQRLGGYGSLALSASISDYYSGKQRDGQLQLSYQHQIGSVGYGCRSRASASAKWAAPLPMLDSGRVGNTVSFNLSMPLGTARRAPMLAASSSRSGGEGNQQLSLSGSADEAQTLSYGVNVARAVPDGSGSLSANAQKRFAPVTLGGSYSRGVIFRRSASRARRAGAASRRRDFGAVPE